jgi:hypothetical protein
VIDQYKYYFLHENDVWEDHIKAIVTAELAEKCIHVKT